jgi:hypothetical protein
LLIVSATLAAAGCGGGSKQTTTTATSRADFIEVADAICGNHQSRREDLESQARELGALTTPAKARKVAAILRQESSNLEAEARELQDRPAPAANRAQLETLFATIRERADAIDRWARGYDRLNERAIRLGQIRVGVLTARAEKVASAYGFRVCGR